MQDDPARLFALAASGPPEPDWHGFERSVRAAIEDQDRRAGWPARWLDSGLFAPKRLAASLAMGAAVLALAVVAVWQPLRGPSPEETVVIDLPPVAEAPLPAPVESVASPTARVVHMQIGEQDEPSDFVLILDEGIDL
jgi:hypothetical protein